MNYVGKSLDGFSYAVRGLLDVNHVDSRTIPEPDCLSCRAFSFLMGDYVVQWFQPAVTWQTYMDFFSRNLGIEEQLKACDANVFFREQKDFSNWFLIGEVIGLEAIKTIRTSLYQGAKEFYLCKRYNHNKMILCDPMGSPYRLVDYDTIKNNAENSGGFVAWYKHNSRVKIQIALPRAVVKQAVVWKKEHQDFLIRNQLPNAIEKYSGIGRDGYSMQFARMNYHIQMKKSVEYFCQAGMLTDGEYNGLCYRLNRLPLIRRKDDFYVFAEIEDMLWDCLEIMV